MDLIKLRLLLDHIIISALKLALVLLIKVENQIFGLAESHCIL